MGLIMFSSPIIPAVQLPEKNKTVIIGDEYNLQDGFLLGLGYFLQG